MHVDVTLTAPPRAGVRPAARGLEPWLPLSGLHDPQEAADPLLASDASSVQSQGVEQSRTRSQQGDLTFSVKGRMEGIWGCVGPQVPGVSALDVA